LSNSGGGSSSRITVTLANAAGTAFAITSNGCNGANLGAKKSCTVTVTYAPLTTGDADGATVTASGQHRCGLDVLGALFGSALIEELVERNPAKGARSVRSGLRSGRRSSSRARFRSSLDRSRIRSGGSSSSRSS
jgi:hypothetical protein